MAQRLYYATVQCRTLNLSSSIIQAYSATQNRNYPNKYAVPRSESQHLKYLRSVGAPSKPNAHDIMFIKRNIAQCQGFE